MAEKRRFLDVWIVESNTVYKEVPFTVVADWIQQGRLLEDDMVKPSGTAQWLRLGGSPELAPYIPRPEPYHADDDAEALEPVHLDFAWKHPRDEEDDDVDMIPLIDVSLVLLIFFMLTATAVAFGGFIPTPGTQYGEVASNPEAIRIDIDWQDDKPVYSLGVGDKPADEDHRNLETQTQLPVLLRSLLADVKVPTEVVINAHKELPSKYARELRIALRDQPFRSKITVNYYGVSDTEP